MLTKKAIWPPQTRVLIFALVGLSFALSSLGTPEPAEAGKRGGKGVEASKRSKPRAIPGLKLSSRHVSVGDAIRVRGRARPGGRRKLKVVIKGPSGEILRKWTSKRGRYRLRWRPSRTGIYRLRAYVGRNGKARRGAGTRRTVTVYRPAHASWYGPGFYGGRTACGHTLTPSTLGVAHKTLPCGTKVRFRLGNRKVAVPVIDRGPFIPGREYDLTYATKEKLRFGDVGTVYASR